MKDLFVECVERAYFTKENDGEGLFLHFETRCCFVGPRLKVLLQNALLCTPRGVQELLQTIVGGQKARKVSRVDRWCILNLEKETSNEKKDVIKIIHAVMRNTDPIITKSICERFSPWII